MHFVLDNDPKVWYYSKVEYFSPSRQAPQYDRHPARCSVQALNKFVVAVPISLERRVFFLLGEHLFFVQKASSRLSASRSVSSSFPAL